MGASQTSRFCLKVPFGLFLLPRRTDSPRSRIMSTKLGLTLRHLSSISTGWLSDDSSDTGLEHHLSVR